MFFVLSKVFGFVTAPSNALALVGLLGVVLAAFGARGAGLALMATSILGLVVFGLSPAANLLLLPLEERFPRTRIDAAPDGIIVLGGSFDTVVAGARREIALTEAAERLTEIATLARRWPEARIVFSGGSGQIIYDGATEADLAARVFESFGVPAERMIFEGRSRNTVENARFTRELVTPAPNERWLLVTSAYHMPRAVGCFRKVGFDVEAWPVDFRTRGPEDAARPFSSVSAGLRRTDVAVREWVGLVTYWLLGYVVEPLPRPAKGDR
ncbi:YdcF family protein [Chenggangzhangella methanolivorans]|uniref:YdcF family protein n=1 Tax=Chenggangzhangella methanolivorans TaxID=1437009 RepID=A0A9E6R8Y3_9HYPH|nr:YdcF family protein [Chenggangzhangella methanolivorans]QZO00386.1 YdcF family protein [Chenggangzhangella methanolivorans]